MAGFCLALICSTYGKLKVLMIPSDTLNAQGYAPEPVAASAVSWGAILAGAVGAAALSLILLMLGVGLGLTSVSPWARTPVDAVGIGVSTIVWDTDPTSGFGYGRFSGRSSAHKMGQYSHGRSVFP